MLTPTFISSQVHRAVRRREIADITEDQVRSIIELTLDAMGSRAVITAIVAALKSDSVVLEDILHHASPYELKRLYEVTDRLSDAAMDVRHQKQLAQEGMARLEELLREGKES